MKRLLLSVAVVLLIAAVVLSLNLVIDLLYGVLDPRIHYQ